MHASVTARLDALRALTVDCPIRIDWLTAQNRDGDRKSPYKGAGREYCDFRDYQPGDNVRRINWKMVGKRPDRPQVTQFEEERNACVAVIANVGRTMDGVSVALSKRELACVLTASILRSAARTNDAALFLGYDQSGVVCSLSRRSSAGLTQLAPAAVLCGGHGKDEEPGEPGLAGALARLPSSRSLVFVLSDMLDFQDQDREVLGYLGAKHEIVFLTISDLRERELPSEPLLPFLPIAGLYTMVDQNGVRRTVATTKKRRRQHRERFQAHEARLFGELAELNCKFAAMHTEDDHDVRRDQLASILSGGRGSLDLLSEPAVDQTADSGGQSV